jgi:transcriptional regulator with XRE-family HTH domain
MAAASQTTTYKKRLRKHSGLSQRALLVALTIADLRWEAGLKQHEPLPLTLEALAEACHMPRRNLIRWLKEATDSGWIRSRQVFRDGRQKPNEYLLADPTAVTPSATSGTRQQPIPSATSGTQKRAIPSATVADNSCRPWHTVVRSNNYVASADAAHSGGSGSDGQGHTETRTDPPGTAPASEGRDEPGTADGHPARAEADNGEPVSEEQLLDQFEAESRDGRLMPPPPRQTNVVAVEGDRLAAACHHCNGQRPVLSDLHRPPGAPRLWECLECGRYWHKALRLVSA